MIFYDTIKADSEREAYEQIHRLYPSAEDINLESRETADGRESSTGKHFTFEVEMQQDYSDFDFDDLTPEDLGEEEY